MLCGIAVGCWCYCWRLVLELELVLVLVLVVSSYNMNSFVPILKTCPNFIDTNIYIYVSVVYFSAYVYIF